jgi:two-component system chemotaxis sensor kinase CheA
LKQLARFHEREPGRLERMGRLLSQLGRTSEEEITRLGLVADELDEAIRRMRLLPFSTVFNLFPRLVRDLSRSRGKKCGLSWKAAPSPLINTCSKR